MPRVRDIVFTSNGQTTILFRRRNRFTITTESELATGRVRPTGGPDWRLSEAIKSHFRCRDEAKSFVKSAAFVGSMKD